MDAFWLAAQQIPRTGPPAAVPVAAPQREELISPEELFR
jgi:hypothetical protein